MVSLRGQKFSPPPFLPTLLVAKHLSLGVRPSTCPTKQITYNENRHWLVTSVPFHFAASSRWVVPPANRQSASPQNPLGQVSRAGNLQSRRFGPRLCPPTTRKFWSFASFYLTLKTLPAVTHTCTLIHSRKTSHKRQDEVSHESSPFHATWAFGVRNPRSDSSLSARLANLAHRRAA